MEKYEEELDVKRKKAIWNLQVPGGIAMSALWRIKLLHQAMQPNDSFAAYTIDDSQTLYKNIQAVNTFKKPETTIEI